MGMTIDEAISDLTELKICGVVPFTKGTISGGNYKVITEECLDTAIETMRKYQMFQADYENRLKAEMVAMLTDLQLEIEDKAIRKQGIDSGFEYNYEFIQSEEVIEIIQQKIDKLKENIDGDK
jgi:hypothetical protein